MNEISSAAAIIRSASYLSALTGAGISVESGIPPFRGEDGLWAKYDPELFEISYFRQNPLESWRLLKRLFYEGFKDARPNEAHAVLARLEKKGIVKRLITQNIDNLHHMAGSTNIIEYHGSLRLLLCTTCGKSRDSDPAVLQTLPPRCPCGGILKPDIVFFGEDIPHRAVLEVERTLNRTDAVLVVGTTGEVFPAGLIPLEAKRRGAKIIEVNVQPSSLTFDVTDVFLQGKATAVLSELEKAL